MAGSLVALVIAVVLVPQPPHPWPKETVELAVAGPRLEHDLEITDPVALAADVYAETSSRQSCTRRTAFHRLARAARAPDRAAFARRRIWESVSRVIG